jgi:hypothetical protein
MSTKTFSIISDIYSKDENCLTNLVVSQSTTLEQAFDNEDSKFSFLLKLEKALDIEIDVHEIEPDLSFGEIARLVHQIKVLA